MHQNQIYKMENLGDFNHYLTAFLDRVIAFIPDLIAALLILVIGWWLIKIVLKYVRKIFQKQQQDKALENFIITVLNWALKIMLFIMVVNQIGIQTTSLIAALGAAGLAVGLALQGSLANFAGGVLIILLKPFRLGDWIEVDGISGSVKEISLFYTKLNTFGNQLAVLPNGDLSNDNVINYSGEGIRRDAITIRLTYGSDIKAAKKVLLELLQEQEDILKDPAPAVVVGDLTENSIDLSVRFWAANGDFWDRRWYTLEHAPARLEAVGVTVALPQREVRLYSDDPDNTTEQLSISKK